MKKWLSFDDVLMMEWHPTKNENILPSEVSQHSHKKLWWKCSRGHEWLADVRSRSAGRGCPYCSGRQVTMENSLASKFPDVASMWNWEKNKGNSPKNYSCFSSKKVWWKCEKGHEWEAVISNRARGSNCPYCSKKIVSKDYNLRAMFPEIAKQWHPTKNGDLKPENVTIGSSKKVWWRCDKDDDHEWIATVYSRVRMRSGCPICAGRIASKNNNLSVKFPRLAKEWHPEKNGSLAPDNCLPGSKKKIWWVCKNKHEFEMSINRRVQGVGCQLCKK